MSVNSIEICKSDVVDQNKVETVASLMPPASQIEALTEIFKILGDHTRLRIVLGLSRGEMCVCELAVLINLSVSAISHQLRQLRDLKLVKYRKEGKLVYYSLDDEHIDHIIGEAWKHVQE